MWSITASRVRGGERGGEARRPHPPRCGCGNGTAASDHARAGALGHVADRVADGAVTMLEHEHLVAGAQVERAQHGVASGRRVRRRRRGPRRARRGVHASRSAAVRNAPGQHALHERGRLRLHALLPRDLRRQHHARRRAVRAVIDGDPARDRAPIPRAQRHSRRAPVPRILPSGNAARPPTCLRIPTAPKQGHKEDARENHRNQDVPDAGRRAARQVLGLGRQELAHDRAQLALRQGLHRRRPHRHRRMQRMAARDRARRAGSRPCAGRRGPRAYRAPVAEDDERHHGPRHDRRGGRRRHDGHRHGAVGHQGQGAQHAGVEPARRQGARQDPHLQPCQHARGRARPRLARHHRDQDRRREGQRAQGRDACARRWATRST